MKKNNGAKMVEKKIEDIKGELEILDDMLSALVDLLTEKEIISDEEWEKKVKDRLKESKKLKNIKDLLVIEWQTIKNMLNLFGLENMMKLKREIESL